MASSASEFLNHDTGITSLWSLSNPQFALAGAAKSGELRICNRSIFQIWKDHDVSIAIPQAGVQADKATGDYFVCHGAPIDLNEILNKDMLTSAGIKAMRQQFQTNTPFPHLVIDHLFSPKLLELMYAEFDDMKWNDWRVTASPDEIKRGTLPNAALGPAARIYFQTIATGAFIDIQTDHTDRRSGLRY